MDRTGTTLENTLMGSFAAAGMYLLVYVNIYIHICICVYIFTHVYIYYVCIYVFMYICLHDIRNTLMGSFAAAGVYSYVCI
jgi:hypothetical protein